MGLACLAVQSYAKFCNLAIFSFNQLKGEANGSYGNQFIIRPH